ncbi:hypothetical protein [Bradyrhizobium sp. 195]|uniref:hypothetical protein n=1 Tax=Bradyrhizobium sp. 195 TaxID=2782662 RepID=UPI002001AD60|nr:hypothetical protein [Bradyrhizobium sp. 195]UPK26833.1 hypothetical protein IVB26_37360 [Bradyrhizobium sp. 195]
MAPDGKPYSNSYAWIMLMQDGSAEVTANLDLAPYDDILRHVLLPAQSRWLPVAMRLLHVEGAALDALGIDDLQRCEVRFLPSVSL